MKNKIIPIQHYTCKEVLLQVRRTEKRDYLEITAWHETESDLLIQQSKINFKEFSNPELMMERYMLDFSATSAVDFADSFNL